MVFSSPRVWPLLLHVLLLGRGSGVARDGHERWRRFSGRWLAGPPRGLVLQSARRPWLGAYAEPARKRKSYAWGERRLAGDSSRLGDLAARGAGLAAKDAARFRVGSASRMAICLGANGCAAGRRWFGKPGSDPRFSLRQLRRPPITAARCAGFPWEFAHSGSGPGFPRFDRGGRHRVGPTTFFGFLAAAESFFTPSAP